MVLGQRKLDVNKGTESERALWWVRKLLSSAVLTRWFLCHLLSKAYPRIFTCRWGVWVPAQEQDEPLQAINREELHLGLSKPHAIHPILYRITALPLGFVGPERDLDRNSLVPHKTVFVDLRWCVLTSCSSRQEVAPWSTLLLMRCCLISFLLLSLENTCDQIYTKVIINDLKKQKKKESLPLYSIYTEKLTSMCITLFIIFIVDF